MEDPQTVHRAAIAFIGGGDDAVQHMRDFAWKTARAPGMAMAAKPEANAAVPIVGDNPAGMDVEKFRKDEKDGVLLAVEPLDKVALLGRHPGAFRVGRQKHVVWRRLAAEGLQQTGALAGILLEGRMALLRRLHFPSVFRRLINRVNSVQSIPYLGVFFRRRVVDSGILVVHDDRSTAKAPNVAM